jgi:hypothetical protein
MISSAQCPLQSASAIRARMSDKTGKVCMAGWRGNVLIRKALRGAAVAIAQTSDEIVSIIPASSSGLYIDPLSASGADTIEETV